VGFIGDSWGTTGGKRKKAMETNVPRGGEGSDAPIKKCSQLPLGKKQKRSQKSNVKLNSRLKPEGIKRQETGARGGFTGKEGLYDFTAEREKKKSWGLWPNCNGVSTRRGGEGRNNIRGAEAQDGATSLLHLLGRREASTNKRKIKASQKWRGGGGGGGGGGSRVKMAHGAKRGSRRDRSKG